MTSDPDLRISLSRCLPSGNSFLIHHISTPPTLTCALYTPPPATPPQKSFCESHLLLLSHFAEPEHRESPLATFAIEVLVYTTQQLTTVFVSKADSTGFAAGLPSIGNSILRSLTSTFVSHIINQRHRPRRRLVLSLFARAQDQYLFPGSSENPTKHILDDRQLVRWWCRVADPILRHYNPETSDAVSHTPILSKAHLIVPGHDDRETASFFPSSARADSSEARYWYNSHPLRDIAPYNAYTVASRSLIPHFPDDPKSRFLLDLDEEISDAPVLPSSQKQKGRDGNEQPSPSKRGNGQWKSVRSIEQFWEMMAWRQECSSGRMVGFLWVTFTPTALVGIPSSEQSRVDETPASPILGPTKRKRANEGSDENHDKQPKKPKLTMHKRRPQGVIESRTPRAKTISTLRSRVPEKTKHFYWPASSRGTLVVNEKAYHRIHEILLRLDFAGVDTARGSTMKWASEAAIIAGRKANGDWGLRVDGVAPVVERITHLPYDNSINDLSAGLVRKKDPGDNVTTTHVRNSGPAANDLGATLVRKKPKQEPVPSDGVKNLGPELVRKKAMA